MSDELKPCPACGSSYTQSCVYMEDGDMAYCIQCCVCACSGPGDWTETGSITEWNALPLRPRWTNEPPISTDELWFYRAPSSEPVIVRTFRSTPDLPLMAAYLDGHRRPSCDPGYTAVADMPGPWAGPISMPEDAR